MKLIVCWRLKLVSRQRKKRKFEQTSRGTDGILPSFLSSLLQRRIEENIWRQFPREEALTAAADSLLRKERERLLPRVFAKLVGIAVAAAAAR